MSEKVFGLYDGDLFPSFTIDDLSAGLVYLPSLYLIRFHARMHSFSALLLFISNYRVVVCRRDLWFRAIPKVSCGFYILVVSLSSISVVG